MVQAEEADARALMRLGGYSGLALGAGYVVIVALYAIVGAVPSGDGAAWLDYLSGNIAAWWGIVGLSALTDVLYLPLAAGLYIAIGRVNRTLMLVGVGLLSLFVVLDLAVTQINFAALITMSSELAAGSNRFTPDSLAAASYPASVLASSLFAVYAIGIPSLGILAIGAVMLRASFSTVAGWAGVLTGILGVASVVGPFFVSSLGALAIPTSLLTTLWVAAAGYRLLLPVAPIAER